LVLICIKLSMIIRLSLKSFLLSHMIILEFLSSINFTIVFYSFNVYLIDVYLYIKYVAQIEKKEKWMN